jgi:hypothetical protein
MTLPWAPTEAQKAVFSVLSADATLVNLLGANKVFDHVPDNTPYPYVVLQVLPWTDRGNHTYEGWACEFQLTVWYRATGRGNLGVQTIQKRIDELLHRVDLCIEGWNSVGLRRTFVDIITDDDNVTKQGIQRFNLLIGEG